MHLRAYNSAPSYNFTYPIMGLKTPKWDHIFIFCSYCTSMNDPYFESSEQLDCLFTYSTHKIKFHIFQKILKCSIHRIKTI